LERQALRLNIITITATFTITPPLKTTMATAGFMVVADFMYNDNSQ